MEATIRTNTPLPKVCDNKDELEKTGYWKVLDQIIWMNIFQYVVFHIGAVYGIYLCFSDAKLMTIIFGEFWISQMLS